MTISEQLLTVQGRNVRYYEAGEPHLRSLFFLHGHLGDAWMHWAEIMPMLYEEYHLIAVDLPGYGQSDPLPHTTPETMMQWTIDVIETLGLDSAVLIGNSFGGLVARLVAANLPKYVPALVLVNGGVIPAVPGAARLLARLPLVGGFIYNRVAASTISRPGLVEMFEDKELLTDAVVSRVRDNKAGLAKLMRALSLADMPDKRVPPVPVLLLWGEEDSITPRVVGERIQANIPGSKLELISDTRHLPHVEEPEVFVWQVTSFLRQISQPRDDVDI